MATKSEAVGKAIHSPDELPELPTFRFALEASEGLTYPSGSAKEATVRQLPIATGLSGVTMRLKPGGLRELHWHVNAAEWGYILKGRCRTTIISPDGTSEINDFNPGDVWYFPRGYGHSIQGLGTEECHFLLVFDNGSFSEFGTFSSSDWLGHTPPEVLSQSFGLSLEDLKQFPTKEMYILSGPVPADHVKEHQPGLKSAPLTHRYELMAQEPYAKLPGGTEWRASAKEFPISKTMTGIILELEPGAMREPHWHPNANEWQYVLSGSVRITLFGSGGRARTEDFSPGDVGYAPQGYGHYIQNTSDQPSQILIAFDQGEYQEISLSTWLAANPTALVAENFQISEELASKLPDQKVFIAPKR